MGKFKKFQAFLAVLGVFLVILATNLIDKQNFLKVEEAVENIYNDRLLAKELLLEASIKFHQKELAYAMKDSTYLKSKNDVVNAELTEILALLETTESTKKEKTILRDLNETHAELMALEAKCIEKDTLYSIDCAAIFASLNTDIIELSAEQVNEGNNQRFNAREAVNTAKLFSKIEIYMLIFLALILQIIILYKPKEKPNERYEM